MRKLAVLVLIGILGIAGNAWGQSIKPTYIPKVTTITSSATPTPMINSTGPVDYVVSALAAAAVFATPSGAPLPGQVLTIYIKDDGNARALDFTTSTAYVPINVTLPVTTVPSKWLYLGMKYNARDSKWHVLAVGQES